MNEFGLQNRALFVQASLIAVIAAMLLSIWALSAELSLLTSLQDGIRPSDAEINDVDTLLRFSFIVSVGTGAVAILTYYLWLHAAYSTYSDRVTHGARFTPGWAVGMYFVPVVNLVRPYQAMAELTGPNSYGTDVGGQGSALIKAWWAMFVLAVAAGLAVGSYLPSDEIEELIQADWLAIGASGIRALAAVGGIAVVRLATATQLDTPAGHSGSQL